MKIKVVGGPEVACQLYLELTTLGYLIRFIEITVLKWSKEANSFQKSLQSNPIMPDNSDFRAV